MDKISEWVLIIMEQLGLLGVTLMMFLENVFPPIPSELIMPAAGFAAAMGKMNLILVIVAGTLGSVLGALPLYYLGTIFDEKRLLKLTEKYGKYVLVKPSDVTNAQAWFNKYGKAVIFFWAYDSCHSFADFYSCGHEPYANDSFFDFDNHWFSDLDNAFGVCRLCTGGKLRTSRNLY